MYAALTKSVFRITIIRNHTVYYRFREIIFLSKYKYSDVIKIDLTRWRFLRFIQRSSKQNS